MQQNLQEFMKALQRSISSSTPQFLLGAYLVTKDQKLPQANSKDWSDCAEALVDFVLSLGENVC